MANRVTPCQDPAVVGGGIRRSGESAARPARVPQGVFPLLTLAVVVALVVIGGARGLWLANLHNGLLALACAGVGTYVAWQRPAHLVGRLLLWTGLVEAVMFTGRQFGHGPGAGEHPWLVWLGVWPLAIGLALTTLSVLVFPDGRLPSPRWRPVGWGVIVAGVLCAAASALWPVEYEAAAVMARHPINATAPPAIAEAWAAIAHPVYAILQMLWLVAIVARWRGAGALVRRQLAWLVTAAGLSVVALLTGLVVSGSPRAGVLAAVLVPIAAGIAIVHGQHLAAYAALSWLSRAAPDTSDRPTDLAAAAALAGSAAVLWMGDAGRLHAIGVWPPSEEAIEPRSLAVLVDASPGGYARAVTTGDVVIGALTVTPGAAAGPSRNERRLLDDLAAQAALLLEHLDLSGVIDRERQAGHLEALTGREREVLDLMARGLSNAAISRELHLSIKTVEPAVSAIFAKLDLGQNAASNRRVLAVLAYLRV